MPVGKYYRIQTPTCGTPHYEVVVVASPGKYRVQVFNGYVPGIVQTNRLIMIFVQISRIILDSIAYELVSEN